MARKWVHVSIFLLLFIVGSLSAQNVDSLPRRNVDTVEVRGEAFVANRHDIDQGYRNALLAARMRALESRGIFISSVNSSSFSPDTFSSFVQSHVNGVILSDSVLVHGFVDSSRYHIVLRAIVAEDEYASSLRPGIAVRVNSSEYSDEFEGFLREYLEYFGFQIDSTASDQIRVRLHEHQVIAENKMFRAQVRCQLRIRRIQRNITRNVTGDGQSQVKGLAIDFAHDNLAMTAATRIAHEYDRLLGRGQKTYVIVINRIPNSQAIVESLQRPIWTENVHVLRQYGTSVKIAVTTEFPIAMITNLLEYEGLNIDRIFGLEIVASFF